MFTAPLPVSQIVAQCAPRVSPDTLTAIVDVESGGDPLAIHDNANGRTYHPKTRVEAVRLLKALMASGANIDVGLGQVDTENFAHYHLTADNAFNVCRNIRAAGNILTVDYLLSKTLYHTNQTALYHAFELYNSGQTVGDPGYADKVMAAAGLHTLYLTHESSGLLSTRPHYPTYPQYRWSSSTTKAHLQSVSWSVLP